MLLMSRFTKMFSAAELVQYYVLAKFERRHFVHMRKSAIKIQRSFRGWVVRTFLAWQKLMVLYRMELASMDKITRNQRKKIHELLGARPMSLIMLTSCIDIRAFYKDGWMRGYEEVIRRDGIQKMAVGAEHTVVVAQSGLYCWGSDEVGQLGRGDPKAMQTEKSFGPVAPLLKNRVSDIACGRWHTLAIVAGPQPLWSWGLNHRGQCGLKSYIKGAAFTPSYPKLVRTPTSLSVNAVVSHIAAGPFHSAALVGAPSVPYLWGEGDACGQMRDVRLPLKITDEQFSCTALGDGFCLLLQDDNVKALGRKCVQLGLGPNFDENHMEKFQAHGRLEKHEAYLRFDTSTFLGRGNIITTPTPCKLPKMTVQAVCTGEMHVLCLMGHGDVFEWGTRHVVATSTKTREKDRGRLMNISAPVKMHMQMEGQTVDHPAQIRAGGDISVIISGKDVAYGWNFFERADNGESKPALWSFRHLRNTATRLEMCASPSLVCVLGYSDKWKELDVREVDWERQRPRGAKQPMTPAIDAMEASRRTPMRMTMGKPMSSDADSILTPRPGSMATPRAFGAAGRWPCDAAVGPRHPTLLAAVAHAAGWVARAEHPLAAGVARPAGEPRPPDSGEDRSAPGRGDGRATARSTLPVAYVSRPRLRRTQPPLGKRSQEVDGARRLAASRRLASKAAGVARRRPRGRGSRVRGRRADAHALRDPGLAQRSTIDGAQHNFQAASEMKYFPLLRLTTRILVPDSGPLDGSISSMRYRRPERSRART